MKKLLTAGLLCISCQALAEKARVVFYEAGCDYFIADGPMGYYLLQWFGGYDPSQGDILVGQIASFGFKDVYYIQQDIEGKIYVDDYMLSKDNVVKKYYEKCR